MSRGSRYVKTFTFISEGMSKKLSFLRGWVSVLFATVREK